MHLSAAPESQESTTPRSWESTSNSPSQQIRVLIAGETRIGTQLLCEALSRDLRFAVSEYRPDMLQQALTTFDVALVSAKQDAEPLDGIDLARQMRAGNRAIRSIIVVDHSTPPIVLQVFRSGAWGVFCRSESVESLCKCIWGVHHGHIWANDEELGYLLQALREPVPIHLRDVKGEVLLSKREEQVVSSVVEGLTNREIADRLQLSEHTVKNYLFRIFDKLGISSRSELILYTLSKLGADQPAPKAAPRPGLQCNASCRNEDTVVSCCREGVERLSIAAQVLGEIPREGEGALADKVSTQMWFEVAQALSKSAQNQLLPTMTPDQVAESRRRAAEWLKSCGRPVLVSRTDLDTTVLPRVA